MFSNYQLRYYYVINYVAEKEEENNRLRNFKRKSLISKEQPSYHLYSYFHKF